MTFQRPQQMRVEVDHDSQASIVGGVGAANGFASTPIRLSPDGGPATGGGKRAYDDYVLLGSDPGAIYQAFFQANVGAAAVPPFQGVISFSVSNPSDIDFTVSSFDYPDFNGDLSLDDVDFETLRSHFGQSGSFEAGDINGDGVVDKLDLITLYNDPYLALSDAEQPQAAAFYAANAPEPSSLSMLALGGMALARRRRGTRN